MAKFSFGKFISIAVNVAEKAIKSAVKEQNSQPKAVMPSILYGNVPKPKTKQGIDTLNRSYRALDYERYSQVDAVVGIEIHLSNSHKEKMPLGDMCDLLVGKYPKTFKWSGFHKGCMCFTTSILCTNAEMKEYLTTGVMKSENEVREIPEAFYDWMLTTNENWEKFDFIKDNQKLIKKRTV